VDLPAEKYKLIEWLMSLEDESTVKRLQEIRNETLDSGEPYEISESESLFIKAGLKDIEEGRTYSHEDVMREVRAKYNL
jgi:DUF438 domain-containing protein